MNKNDFFDLYKDPRWQKKRLEIMERDEFMCQVCGEKESELNVHHLIYFKDKKIWDYENDYLITLCAECHKIVHSEKEIMNIILAKIPVLFISDYSDILLTLLKIDPGQLALLNKFIKSMLPFESSSTPEKQFYE